MQRPLLALALAVFVAVGAPAAADTLYQAAPPPAGPGHPLRLGPDHRAQQVGDLLQVVFNFSVSSASQNASNVNNSYSVSGGPGSGIFGLPLVRLSSALGASRQSSSTKSDVGSNSFVTSMQASVTDVLPSGALRVAGDQELIVDGQKQTLHVTGLVRPEDIDFTDSVLSTRLADVHANFDGKYSEARHPGILQKIIGWLF
ncbi:MAG TPA: flagellar basal body L-ring protein FlgH [Candidatus Acidoferrum sp.]|jgi:flagellar L-ring protein precursor FlgH|nr:flagellar basal body L-ring protein FlgH [Candidatus Acidoferrum sp.]